MMKHLSGIIGIGTRTLIFLHLPSPSSDVFLFSGYTSHNTGFSFFALGTFLLAFGSGIGNPSLRRMKYINLFAKRPMPIKATNSARKATRKLKGMELRPRSFGLLLLVVVVELVDDVVVEGVESAVEEVEVAV